MVPPYLEVKEVLDILRSQGRLALISAAVLLFLGWSTLREDYCAEVIADMDIWEGSMPELYMSGITLLPGGVCRQEEKADPGGFRDSPRPLGRGWYWLELKSRLIE
jgi:hypothetical protein